MDPSAAVAPTAWCATSVHAFATDKCSPSSPRCPRRPPGHRPVTSLPGFGDLTSLPFKVYSGYLIVPARSKTAVVRRDELGQAARRLRDHLHRRRLGQGLLVRHDPPRRPHGHDLPGAGGRPRLPRPLPRQAAGRVTGERHTALLAAASLFFALRRMGVCVWFRGTIRLSYLSTRSGHCHRT